MEQNLISNTAKWMNFFGLDVPAWINHTYTDEIAIVICTVVMCFSFLGLFFPKKTQI